MSGSIPSGEPVPTAKAASEQTAPAAQPGPPPAATTPSAPPPAEAKPALTDAEINALSTKHAAWVAAGAAILAAVIAFGGTWWSAGVAAKAASETVTKQLSGETEKSRAEFLRGQRQILYAKIVVAEAAVKRGQDQTFDATFENIPKVRIQNYLATRELQGKFETDYLGSAEIIASEDFKSCYFRLIFNNEDAARQASSFIFGTPQRRKQAQAKFSEIYNEREANLLKLYEAARRDMGVTPPGNNRCA
jgi:hypothetical protein